MGCSATASATLAVSLEALGHILREQGDGDCVTQHKDAIQHCQRIDDTAEEAINHYNLGHAYKNLPAIRDLDAALRLPTGKL